MKVKEMKELLAGLKSEGKIDGQKVEFVLDTKKYFASNVKAGANTMTLEITRENYHPLSLESFESNLDLAGGDLEIQVVKGKNTKTITESYLTDSALELVLG